MDWQAQSGRLTSWRCSGLMPWWADADVVCSKRGAELGAERVQFADGLAPGPLPGFAPGFGTSHGAVAGAASGTRVRWMIARPPSGVLSVVPRAG
jgi:hypothetical protein